jgi:hypothetical protein
MCCRAECKIGVQIQAPKSLITTLPALEDMGTTKADMDKAKDKENVARRPDHACSSRGLKSGAAHWTPHSSQTLSFIDPQRCRHRSAQRWAALTQDADMPCTPCGSGSASVLPDMPNHFTCICIVHCYLPLYTNTNGNTTTQHNFSSE